MSYHSTVPDYSCEECGEEFLPFHASMHCPKCDTKAAEETYIVQDTLEALEWHKYQQPMAYGVFTLADSYIHFALRVSAQVEFNDDPVKLARMVTLRVADGDDHLRITSIKIPGGDIAYGC
jgi:hypothetical protein